MLKLGRDLSMCLSHTVGLALHMEAIKLLDDLFSFISEEDFYQLPDDASKKTYILCKFVYFANYCNCYELSYAELAVQEERMLAFLNRAASFASPGYLNAIRENIYRAKAIEGTQIEFPVRGDMPDVELLFAATKESLPPETLAALNAGSDDMLDYVSSHKMDDGHNTTLLAWAELAHKLGKISTSEYHRFLHELAVTVMAKPTAQELYNTLYARLQIGLSATGVLCKYYETMTLREKANCEQRARQCISWVASFPAGGRMALGCLGNELMTVVGVATLNLSKRGRAEAILKLTTESTYAHSILCAEMAVDLASAMLKTNPLFFNDAFPNASHDEIINEIYIGALMHDIGKLEVSGPVSQVVRNIFNEEFALIKTHPMRAIRYLQAPTMHCARACAAWHHEHFDGLGGYPLNYSDSASEQFRPVAQLITFVDCFTSAVDKYKSAYQPEKKASDVIKELKVLSYPEASEQFRKPRGRIFYNPVWSEILHNSKELMAKYSNSEHVTNWIESCYYDAYNAFN
jgi:HD-GYP domain-containing protein (c-di-GMP phosphodiesterase class II)